MRTQLHYLLLDGFDPDTGELTLRVGTALEGGREPHILRLRLHLGHAGDALQPLRRELQIHAQSPIPPLWDRGLKLIVRALEDELQTPEGRSPQRYLWVRTQILHPADERRSTLNHPVARQAEVLWDWARRFDQEGDVIRATELLERVLLLTPRHVPSLERLSVLLREQGMIEEMLALVERWLQVEPGNPDALIKKGESLLHLHRHREALAAFSRILKDNPLHPLAHIGAAQAKNQAGGDPCPHLDAAMELDPEVTRSVLRETFDYTVHVLIPGETQYPVEDLPSLLGVSPGEVQAFLQERALPASGTQGQVRESELNRWVTLQNRYQLLPMGLHWMAPTPRHIPELLGES